MRQKTNEIDERCCRVFEVLHQNLKQNKKITSDVERQNKTKSDAILLLLAKLLCYQPYVWLCLSESFAMTTQQCSSSDWSRMLFFFCFFFVVFLFFFVHTITTLTIILNDHHIITIITITIKILICFSSRISFCWLLSYPHDPFVLLMFLRDGQRLRKIARLPAHHNRCLGRERPIRLRSEKKRKNTQTKKWHVFKDGEVNLVLPHRKRLMFRLICESIF